MLGEDHSLIHDFPQHKEKIEQLSQSDNSFIEQSKTYHQLDMKIRDLELNNAPIGDDALHKLKQERALLKDALYQALIKT